MKQIFNLIKKSPHLLSIARQTRSWYRQLGSKKKWKKLSHREIIKIELGSGPKKGLNEWVTIDQVGANINWDLRRGIPLRDNSVDNIYSSHLLEHIPYSQLIGFLKECHRIIKKDGEFSVCVPNFRYYIEAYKEGKLFRPREEWWQPALIDTGSAIDQLNYMAYMNGEHMHMFDEESLINILLKSGFSTVNTRCFDETLDIKERDIESIYAIAYK